jgi:hypothetical protein
MPLFSNKFFPKKPTPRKAELSTINKELAPEKALQDLGLEIGPIKLKLGDQESLFDNGEWVPGNRNSMNIYCTITYNPTSSFKQCPLVIVAHKIFKLAQVLFLHKSATNVAIAVIS